MTPDDQARARALLSLPDAEGEELAGALDAQVADLQRRAAEAPTEALRDKFLRRMTELQSLSAADAVPNTANLPLSGAAAERVTTARADETPAARFHLLEKLATSPAGTYYRAERPATGERIVVCVADASRTADLFRVRAQTATALPADAGGALEVFATTAPPAFQAAERTGQPLRERLDAHRRVRRLEDPSRSLTLVARLARRLDAALPDFAHGAISTDALWIDEAGEVSVLGFALRPLDPAADAASDAYGLAGVLWELIMGRPFEGEAPGSNLTSSQWPPTLAPALQRALSANPTERFRTPGDLADALEGRVRLGWLPPALARRIPALSRNQLLAALGGVATLLVLASAYPLWRDATPWRAAGDRREAARLSGVVEGLATQAAQAGAGIKTAADETKREELRLLERLEGVRAGEEYDEILPRYVEASLASKRASDVSKRFEAANLAAMAQADVAHAEARALLQAEETAHALSRLQALERTYRGVVASVVRIRADLETAEAARAAQLAGAWGAGGCAASSQWAFASGELRVSWPGQGEFRERLVGADDNAVFTVGAAPQETAGRLYSYTLDKGGLTARQLGRRNQEMRLVRC